MAGYTGICLIRYFSTVTKKEDGSVLYWRTAPTRFSGEDIKNVLERKGVPLTDHLPQVYDVQGGGYHVLTKEIFFELPKDGEMLKLDVRLTPLTGPECLNKLSDTAANETSDIKKKGAGIVLANPGPMALYAFGFTTCLLMLQETEVGESHVQYLVMAYAMFHGGLTQFVVGFIEIFRNNLFGATAFTSYGAFWMGWGLYHILVEAEVLPADKYPDAKCVYLIIWGTFTAAMGVQTLFINRALQIIFLTLTLTFYLLAGGVYNVDSKKAAGWMGILCAIVVFYTATAELYNDLGNIHLPLGHVRNARVEFGNSAPGRGEVLSLSDPGGVVPLRLRKDGQNAYSGVDLNEMQGRNETEAV
mmetsp:Transcript_19567/g.27094  ORF Transcript_19567/g.27094 Transcript_19567/m.27094 type:complete len:359 (+) Transcript_19567:179-1255(+)|eukprot:CAMPEP_0196570984 /NCGR_PEP_ID=MMETSP1081-20130531/1163_1 /TAXON_ID=36882 /ORGANISM="Pyramimonas amylifera, Strain CCMP720" /LENGTH=358 /DNA_ID=CAMNT_0041887723 /DNA_START=146 /DNA_END=1222 /DNA_ORIENTATION=+